MGKHLKYHFQETQDRIPDFLNVVMEVTFNTRGFHGWELIEEAIAKKHSTMIEAVAVSKLMNCPKLILTHFSSRYGISNNCVPKMNCKVVLIT